MCEIGICLYDLFSLFNPHMLIIYAILIHVSRAIIYEIYLFINNSVFDIK